MTDERTELVERVENIVFEAMQQGVPKDVMDDTAYGFTCRIIALVREAMLSDNVVAEASVQIDDSWDVPEHALMETARLTIETALDIAGVGVERDAREGGEG